MTQGPIWIVVADTGRARFFERKQLRAKLVEQSELEMIASPAATPRDRPPRVHESQGDARHIMEPRRTPRMAAQLKFLDQVTTFINAAAERDAFERLILCAPPRTLGMLREKLSDPTRKRLTATINRDFMHERVDQLQQRLDEIS